MLTLPKEIVSVLEAFAPLFSKPAFRLARVLVVGTILAIGRRTVTAALRAMGLEDECHFQNYHRLLNRARWSSRKAARILLNLLIAAFAGDGPILLGGDETLERRRGDKIAKKGIYRDAVRSSKSCFVKSSGLRWVCLMLLCPIPWAKRVWALPFLSALAPSERYDEQHDRRHKKITDWMRQMLAQVRRWLPERLLIFVADGGYAALGLLAWCVCHRITVVTRLRLDAALYEPAPPHKPGQKGRPRKKGKRLPALQQVADDPKATWQTITLTQWYGQVQRTIEICSGCAVWFHGGQPPVAIRWVLVRDPNRKFATQALLCTDPTASPEQILAWFVQRWQVETTFQEVRTHLGVETQRQWNDQAIERTTPALLGLFSVVTLIADQLQQVGRLPVRQAAWYVKPTPTFVDALAAVRHALWQHRTFCMSPTTADNTKLKAVFGADLIRTLAYAA